MQCYVCICCVDVQDTEHSDGTRIAWHVIDCGGCMVRSQQTLRLPRAVPSHCILPVWQIPWSDSGHGFSTTDAANTCMCQEKEELERERAAARAVWHHHRLQGLLAPLDSSAASGKDVIVS